MYSAGGRASFPNAGDAEHLAVPTGNRIALPGRVLLKKAVHRHDATPLAVGVAEPLVLGDGFCARVDRREIRTFLATVWNKAPTQTPFDRPSRLGIPPED